ncbi:unnamed protein product [Blepharisma stoltei]|uniref:Mitomycin resistance protein mcrB n=1 Tax=Blepharisma stoltei TaxID=1481888 RepID=A0AAU9K7S1_9CILI|nr:unnamed protein product [Blepharisma stoltei]
MPIKDELRTLANIGVKMREDLRLLKINTISMLAQQDAEDLYNRLNKLKGCRQDPCVWDVFSAAIHQAKTGEATKWWKWTPERKKIQAMRKSKK